MANILDKFLNSMKLYDDDDDFEDDAFDTDETPEEAAPRRPLPRKAEPASEPAARKYPEPEKEKPLKMKKTSSNVVPMKSRGNMEVCMVKPSTLDDAREVCDILLSGRAVVINMEGVHVDLAQRIIDFTSGACFSIDGNLQKISKYIFIVSPHSIGLTGDFQDVLEGSQDLSTLSLNF